MSKPDSDSSDHERPYVHYVYDCGAHVRYARARDREIKSYRGRVRGGRIDLLFLSHMHADHVNGLPKLLSRRGRGPELDTVVMPLVDDVERLIAFAGSLESGATEPSDPFYRDFAVDPVLALGRFSPRQIILVRPGQRRDAGDGAPDLDAPLPHWHDPMRWEEEDVPFPTGAWKLIGRGTVRRRGGSSEGTGSTTNAGASGSRVFEMDHSVALAITDRADRAWLLAPYVDPGIRRGRRAFLDALTNTLQIAPRILRARLADTEVRSSLVANEQAALKAAYKATVADLNHTSMALLSTPVSDRPFAADAYQWLHEQGGTRRRAPCDSARVGWLGTGDADLKTSRRRRAFLDHYRRHLHSIYTLTVPHHGAERNFHERLVRRVRPGLCTLAADQFKNWRHPAPSVVQAIASAGIELRVVTSARQSRIDELVLIDWNCAGSSGHSDRNG